MILKYLDGYGPLPGRAGLIDLDSRPFDPPRALLKRLDGFGVKTYRERNARGDIFEVICFACDALWLKSWVSVDLGDQQRIVPKVEGAGFLRHPIHDDLYCPCEASRFATRNNQFRKFASPDQVQEALEYDLKLSPTTTGGRVEMRWFLGVGK